MKNFRSWIYLGLGVLGGGLLLMCLFLTLNDCLATSPDRQYVDRAVVERVYHKDQHRSRRVGRRYISTGETYRTYHADIRMLSDGDDHTVSISPGEYSRYHKGDTLECKMRRGFFGISIVKDKRRISSRKKSRQHGIILHRGSTK